MKKVAALKDISFLKTKLLKQLGEKGARICVLDRIYIYPLNSHKPLVFRNWLHAARMIHLIT